MTTRTFDPANGSTVWAKTLKQVSEQMTNATFNTWLKDSQYLDFDPSGDPPVLIIGVRNSYAQDWINGRLANSLNRTLRFIAETPLQIHAVVRKKNQVIYSQLNSNGHQPPPEPPAAEPPPDAPAIPAIIKLRDGLDPKRTGFNSVTHYAVRFWRPFIGGQAFDLLMILSAYHYECAVLGKPWPKIEKLARKLDNGTRYTILGRKRDGIFHPGLVHKLEELGLLTHTTKGKGKGLKHYFDIVPIDELPLLTPAQVAQLHKLDQQEHEEFLETFSSRINVEAWKRLK